MDDTPDDGPTAEMEILRGDLAELIYEQARSHTRYRFADRIESVSELGDGVEVSFQSGARERYDVVVVAEGVGSTTRELVMPGDNACRSSAR